MSPLEAMARGMHARIYAMRCEPADPERWDKLSAATKSLYLDDARAALTALRDNGVTDLMLSEAQEYEPITRIEAEHVMRAMLDAVLEGE